MTKIFIFTLGLTNLDLGFRVKEWGFGDMVSNLKKNKIKIFKIKNTILVIFFLEGYFVTIFLENAI